MTIQEAYSYLNFDYYNCVLFLVLFLQEHVKDFISTLVCFLMSTLSVLLADLIIQQGFTFFEAVMLYEAGIAFSCVLLGLLGCRIGLILFTVSCTAFFINFVGYCIPDGELYQLYKQSYGYLNVILFEILVWACIVNSRLKPYIEEYITKLTPSKEEKYD